MPDKPTSDQSVEVAYPDDKGNYHNIFNSDGQGKHGDHGHAVVDQQGNPVFGEDAGDRSNKK